MRGSVWSSEGSGLTSGDSGNNVFGHHRGTVNLDSTNVSPVCGKR